VAAQHSKHRRWGLSTACEVHDSTARHTPVQRTSVRLS
jgi:hypothetical protein